MIKTDTITTKDAQKMLKEAYAVRTMLEDANKHGDFGKDGYSFALLIHDLLIASTNLLVNVVERSEVADESGE